MFHNELYLVIESIPKHGSLNEFLAKEDKRKVLTAEHRCRIMCEGAMAISFLHNGGIVDGASEYKFLHRDINSSCICLTADLTAKLVVDYDKAVVEMHDADDKQVSVDSTTVGTAGYTCPWFSRGNRKYQAECDIFSFGVVLLEMIIGTLQAGQKADRSYGEDLVDRYFFSNDSSLLVKDVDPLAGNEWNEVILSLAKVALSCVDFDPFKRPQAQLLSDKLSGIFESLSRSEL
jgi:serine/threonine protein kinase